MCVCVVVVVVGGAVPRVHFWEVCGWGSGDGGSNWGGVGGGAEGDGVLILQMCTMQGNNSL